MYKLLVARPQRLVSARQKLGRAMQCCLLGRERVMGGGGGGGGE